MTKPDKLLLWDIDGTLIHSGAAGEVALIDAVKTAFGVETNLEGIELSGRTDKSIAMNVLKKIGLEDSPENVARYCDAYLEALAHRLPERRPQGRVYPGILEILEQAQLRPDLAQGLLTGNLERGARLKLEHYDVFHYFKFGAFSDDSHDRNQLPPHAKRRAEEKHGTSFAPEKIFVIGDTPHDIACGKVIGARTIGVATGKFTVQALEACGATAVFNDFSDTGAFFAVVDAL